MLLSPKNLTIFAIVVVVFSSSPANALEALYKAKGDDVVLDPLYPATSITSIVWKHGSDMAAEWDGKDPEYFSQFKGRCMLNYSTGALTITGLNGSENGVFLAVINDKQVEKRISLLVISKVPKPTISSKCNSDSTSCTLTCEGSTEDAELIRYKWFADDVEGGSDRELQITKDTKEESFTCMLMNPVSSERSDRFSNPIIKGERNRLISIIVPTVLILAFIIGLIIFFIRKRNACGSLDLIRARRREEQGKQEETVVIILNGDAVQHKPNGTPVVLELQENANQGSTSAVTLNGVGASDSGSAEPQNDGNIPEEAPLMDETSDQDPESAASPGTREETGSPTATGETPNQDLTVPKPLNTSKETETVTSNNQESTNHEPTLGEEEAADGGDVD